jgi:competence protein ComEA
MIKPHVLLSGSARRSPARAGIFPLRRLLAVPILTLAVGAGLTPVGAGPVHAEEPAAATQSATVNINTADAGTLASLLKGVGNARAIEIVRHREAYGPFTSVDELAEVKGIGPSTLEDNRALITLE